MKQMKKLLSAALAVCLMLTLLAVPATAAPRFADITDTQTAQSVETLRLLGVLDGYADGTFRPGNQLTRAQFCKMAVYAVCGGNEVGLYRAVTVFPDVKPSHWAAAYINMAAKGKGIIAGYADGNFRPESTVTVGHAATILLRLLGYQDQDVGGVWPEGYLAVGRKIGLLDGITGSGSTPLSRGQAARMFSNLLRCSTKDGGEYLSVLASQVRGSVVEDVVLVSSAAKASDGSSTGMKMSNGQVYSLSGGKTSDGVLNGCRGTLLLDGSGKVLTFVPGGSGASRQVAVASCSASRIAGADGGVYTLTASTPAYYEGEESVWGDVYSWLRPGTVVTLHLDAAGAVMYVVAGAAPAGTAVVVSADRSEAGIAQLTGGASGVKVIKNGRSATLQDLRAWDVVTYSPEEHALRVCDTRITVYYESCYPSPRQPETIRVLGRDLTVLPMAVESLSGFKPGDLITLLLTDGGQVAGAVTAGGRVQGNAMGVAAGDGTVQMLCGSGYLTISGAAAESFDGEAAKVYSDKSGVQLRKLTGGISGVLDVEKRTMGGKTVSQYATVFRNGKSMSLTELGKNRVDQTEIAYARTNWAGEVDVIVLKNTAEGEVVYGYVKKTPALDEEGQRLLTVYTPAGVEGPHPSNLGVTDGAWVKATMKRDGTTFLQVEELTKVTKVGNGAWNDRRSVQIGGQTYSVAEDVACYNRDSGMWVTLNQARAYADTATLYLSDGVVRVVEVSA